MTGNLLGEPVEEFVIKEVSNRQKLLGTGIDGSTNRSVKQLNYINNRNAWIKLASSVFIDKTSRLPENLLSPEKYKGLNLAKKAILFNGLSSLENSSYSFRSGISTSTEFWTDSLYGLGGTVQGIQPAPGITSVNVTSRNNGSIRTATINMKAYNRFQFEIIELLYLRLGFTLLLEYGWDKYLDNRGNPKDVRRTLTEDTFFKEDGTTQVQMLSKIKSMRKKYNGNYDGFFGRVKNFSWDFGDDGTYSIRLDLITLGDVIESLKINIPPTEEQKSELGGATSSDIKKYGEVKGSVLLANRNNTKLAAYLYNTIGTDIHKNSPDYFNLRAAINFRDADYDYQTEGRLDLNYNYFIRFGELINILERDIIPTIEPSDKQLLFDNNSTDTTLINYTQNLISFDPRVCIFKYDDGAINQADINSIYVPQYTKSLVSALQKPTNNTDTPPADYGTVTVSQTATTAPPNNLLSTVPATTTKTLKIKSFTGGKVTLEDGDTFNVTSNGGVIGPTYPKTYIINDPSKLTSPASSIGSGDLVFLKLYNIYLNYGFLFDVLGKNTDKEGNLSIFKFLESICDGINKAFANVTKITPTIKDDKIVTFVERKPPAGIINNLSKIPGAKSGNTVELQVYGFDKAKKESNFLKNIKFNTKIGPKLANQISIGATAQGTTIGEDATAFSKWNSGLKDRFQVKVVTPSTTGTATSTTTNSDSGEEGGNPPSETTTADNTQVTYAGSDVVLNSQLRQQGLVLTAPATTFPITIRTEFFKSWGVRLPSTAYRSSTGAIGSARQAYWHQLEYQIDKDGNVITPYSVYVDSSGQSRNKRYFPYVNRQGQQIAYSQRQLINFNVEDENGDTGLRLDVAVKMDILKALKKAYGVPDNPQTEGDDDTATTNTFEQEALDRTKKIANLNYSAYLAQMFGGTPEVSEEQEQDARIQIGTISKRQTQYFPKPNSEYVEMGINAYKVYLQEVYGKEFQESDTPSNQAGFIPVEFDITLDGISGWLIYNKLIIQQTFLPAQYSATLEFLITGVSHKIDQSGWDTNLKTLSTSNIASPPSIKFNPAPAVSARSGGSGGSSGGFSPGTLFTKNSRSVNALKLKGNPSIPVENGFLHKYPGMLVEADSSLYSRLKMKNESDNNKLRLHYAAMPHFKNLLSAYENAVSENGKTFLERYGKLQINSCYRKISSTPGGPNAASPGASRHGLGIAVDLNQPAKYKEVHEWFKANGPGLGWMRIPILRNGTNETWHWELQYQGTYAKISKSEYFIESNIKDHGKNGKRQYSINYKQVTGVENLKPSYVLNQSTWESQKANQIT